jgi:tetratricopeptide (TPR) repeat protein
LRRLLATLALISPLAWSMPADVLRQAEQLVRKGDAAAAAKLLAPFEDEQAGEVTFDYLYGLALLQSGQVSVASLAFERVLARQPNHAAARLDLARAYVALGDDARAQREFESVKKLKPPAAARKAIERGLLDIQKRKRKSRLAGRVETQIGRDSNVNNSTEQSSIFVPLFGSNLTLATTSVGQTDRFAALGAGLDYSYALSQDSAALAAIDVRHRAHRDLEVFDTTSIDLRGGGQFTWGEYRLGAQLIYSDYRLDHTAYRDSRGLAFDWQRPLGAEHSLLGFAQHLRQRYDDSAAAANDVDLNIAGLGVRLAQGDGAALLASALLGREKAVNGRADGDKRVTGWRLGLFQPLDASRLFTLSAGVQDGAYRAENVLFETRRRDRLIDLAAALDWRLGDAWYLRPQLSLSRNRSNIALYDFHRRELLLSLRREF